MDNTESQTATSLWGHPRVRGAVIAVLVLLALFLAAQTINSIKEFRFIGSAPSYNVVSVSGTGEVFAIPDVATFTFSVVEEKASASDAQNAAAEKMESITAFLKEQGIEDKDIKTTGFNLYPRYEYREAVSAVGSVGTTILRPVGGERVLVGFEVNQSVRVKVRDTKQAGQLIAGVSELGASSVSGLNFTIDDEDALKAEARNKAIADAKAKAEMLADELGVRLVRVVSYGEYDQPRFYGVATDAAYGFGGAEEVAVAKEAVIPSGENSITSQVTITYEIR